MGGCSSNEGTFDNVNSDTDPMLNTEGGGTVGNRKKHNQDFGSASMAEVGAMSEQVVYLTAQNSRLTQQLEEAKTKVAKLQQNQDNDKSNNNKGNEMDSSHSTNNIESWTYSHLTYALRKYGVSINDSNLSQLSKNILKLKDSSDSGEYYNNCKQTVKDWMQKNEIVTIPSSGIITICLIQTGFHLEKHNRINELRKIATIARVSDDTLEYINQTIKHQKCVESSYNQVYDI